MIEDHAVPGSPGEAFMTPTLAKTSQADRTVLAAKSRRREAAGARPDWIDGEPPLSDFFEDPLVLAVLRRDGLELDDLAQAIIAGRQRLATKLRSRAA